MITSQSSWLELAREALNLYRAFRDKTQRDCPNPTCPLKLNKKKLTQDELIRRHKTMYAKNHPNSKPPTHSKSQRGR